LFFDVPVDVCIARNRLRERVVPEEAILEMWRKLQPPALDEGFDRVIKPQMDADERG
jgi:predicted kinase